MERRNKKFMLALSPTERAALQRLTNRERLSAAAVVRRLIWREAERIQTAEQSIQSQGASDEN